MVINFGFSCITACLLTFTTTIYIYTYTRKYLLRGYILGVLTLGTDIWREMKHTLHFKNKNLSTNSSRDFNSVLNTINQYWIDPAKYFCPNFSSLSAIYDSFKSKVLKVVELKKRTPLLLSQFFISRNFVAWLKKIPSL